MRHKYTALRSFVHYYVEFKTGSYMDRKKIYGH